MSMTFFFALQCVTNMYLLNLAVADLLFLLLCIPFTAIVFIASWPFGDAMCKSNILFGKINLGNDTFVSCLPVSLFPFYCHCIRCKLAIRRRHV